MSPGKRIESDVEESLSLKKQSYLSLSFPVFRGILNYNRRMGMRRPRNGAPRIIFQPSLADALASCGCVHNRENYKSAVRNG